MSKSIPFLVRPEKLDGSMAGDMGFDPMRLYVSVTLPVTVEQVSGEISYPNCCGFSFLNLSSDIQTDLKYARWSELKHGRICMLAVVGILVQQAGIHFPGEAYTNPDIFGAPSTVGYGVNVQIFLFMCAVELSTFYMHYGEGEPGDLGLDGGLLKNMTPKEVQYRKESEIV